MRYSRIIRVLATCLPIGALFIGNASAQPAQPVEPPAPGPADTAPDGAVQPGPDSQPLEPPAPGPADAAPDGAAQPGPDSQPLEPRSSAHAPAGSAPHAPAYDPARDPMLAANAAPPAESHDQPLQMPVLFYTPSGHLLPAGVIMAGAGVDTGGGVNTGLRVGLGDVAEFGVGMDSLVRVKPGAGGESHEVPAYPSALFKMGISEGLLFAHQPALALGFRKSFGVEHDKRTTRTAQLYLVASKSLGKRFSLHAGGMFWDAAIQRRDEAEVLLHDSGLGKQLRAFGGIQIQPLDRSQILLEVNWTPEFELGDDTRADRIALRPQLTWGVRYELASWALLESGVRVPDIQDVNLIDAQIFGQVHFVTRRLQRFLDRGK